MNELAEKASNEEILKNCPEIKWHFIGHLQTNKINKVLKSPGIDMVETVDSEKLANNLDSAWGKIGGSIPLKVLIQVNSSAESEKNGVEPSHAQVLYKHIKEKCKNLEVRGVMTIGAYGYDYSKGPNPDFVSLMECHKQICEESAVQPEDLHVSMGMSDDFEKAVRSGMFLTQSQIHRILLLSDRNGEHYSSRWQFYFRISGEESGDAYSGDHLKSDRRWRR